jgi:glycosyltransferase involved in cell wall biosynthesis
MIMDPLVSILIPAYNSEKWIADTLRSVIGQTWSRKEIVVVDDGSTDRTLDVAKSFESKTVRVISQPNRGACAARNHAFAQCQGDLIQWLDADDLLSPDKISQQLRRFEKDGDTNILYSAGWGTFYYRPSKARITPTYFWQDLEPLDWLIYRMNSKQIWMHPSVWLVSRNVTERAGPWDERLLRNQDGEYFFRVVAESLLVKFVPESFGYYRKANLGSVSSNYSEAAQASLCLAGESCVKRLLSIEDSNRTRGACIRQYQDILSYLSPSAPHLIERIHRRIIELGGTVEPFSTGWSHSLLRRVVGVRKAARRETIVERAKRRAAINYDKLLAKFFGTNL